MVSHMWRVPTKVYTSCLSLNMLRIWQRLRTKQASQWHQAFEKLVSDDMRKRWCLFLIIFLTFYNLFSSISPSTTQGTCWRCVTCFAHVLCLFLDIDCIGNISWEFHVILFTHYELSSSCWYKNIQVFLYKITAVDISMNLLWPWKFSVLLVMVVIHCMCKIY